MPANFSCGHVNECTCFLLMRSNFKIIDERFISALNYSFRGSTVYIHFGLFQETTPTTRCYQSHVSQSRWCSSDKKPNFFPSIYCVKHRQTVQFWFHLTREHSSKWLVVIWNFQSNFGFLTGFDTCFFCVQQHFSQLMVHVGTCCLQFLQQFMCCCLGFQMEVWNPSTFIPESYFVLLSQTMKVYMVQRFLCLRTTVCTDAHRSFSCLVITLKDELDLWRATIFLGLGRVAWIFPSYQEHINYWNLPDC